MEVNRAMAKSYIECAKCSVSLPCLLGRKVVDSYWCLHCKGWWVPKSLMFVECEDFGNPSRTLKRAINLYTIKVKGAYGFYANYVTIPQAREVKGIYGVYSVEWMYKFERVDNAYHPIVLECPL